MPQSTAGIRAAAERAIQPMGQLDADWYIADRMGKMLAANPDLHTDTLLPGFQQAVKNPLEAHFWLPSVELGLRLWRTCSRNQWCSESHCPARCGGCCTRAPAWTFTSRCSLQMLWG